MSQLSISLGQYSIAGIKPENEDFHGAIIPRGAELDNKGIAVAIADGVSASEGGKEASQIAVRQFLDDYFSTPDSWTVKHAVTKVLATLNQWLNTQGQRQYGGTHGLATTFCALVFKSQTAHLFHVGDSRIYRWRGGALECLTQDHRIHFGSEQEYLARALGIDARLDVDYRTQILQKGDHYLLTTDGVHDVLNLEKISALLDAESADLQQCAEAIVQQALEQGSQDNITCQLVRIDQLADADKNEFYEQLTRLPFPPDLKAGQTMDGYLILRELTASARSQVYLAEDTLDTGIGRVVIKTPSRNFEDDPQYIDLFLHEEWVAKRLDSPHLVKVCQSQNRPRTFLYSVVEYVKGQTLRQWMQDNPQPTLVQVRDSVEQIASGLRAMHRMDMIHQDIKPENILIDESHTHKIIDYGSTHIAGLAESQTPLEHSQLMGTASYSAPEYFKGNAGTNRSDIFSLGVIAYEMLTGELPYGDIQAHKIKKKKFSYHSAQLSNPKVPNWIDAALQKATHPNPDKRYQLLSEFSADLARPNDDLLLAKQKQPLLERDPLSFWKGLALIELILIGVLFLNRL